MKFKITAQDIGGAMIAAPAVALVVAGVVTIWYDAYLHFGWSAVAVGGYTAIAAGLLIFGGRR